MEGGGGGGTRQDKKKGKKRASSSLVTVIIIIIIIIIIELYALFFFRTVTDEKKKRQRDASKRALARLVPPKPTRDDSVNVRETSNTTKRPFGFAIFFLELCSTRKHTRERDAIAHPIEHRRATRHRRQEKKQIFFADVSTNARDRVSRES